LTHGIAIRNLLLHLGGRFPAFRICSSNLEEGFQHSEFRPPTWRKVFSIQNLVLQLGGSFPALGIWSSNLEEAFLLWEFGAPTWRKVFPN